MLVLDWIGGGGLFCFGVGCAGLDTVEQHLPFVDIKVKKRIRNEQAFAINRYLKVLTLIHLYRTQTQSNLTALHRDCNLQHRLASATSLLAAENSRASTRFLPAPACRLWHAASSWQTL